MKKVVFLAMLVLNVASAVSQTKDLPKAVRDSFNKLFPSSVISSWTDNGSYNYTMDWNDDVYYQDYNLNGYTDEYNPYFVNRYSSLYGSPYYYNNDYNENYYYNGGSEMEPTSYNNPTQYQVNFVYENSNMTAVFKPDGTFIIAKGRVNVLPQSVQDVVRKKFSGQSYRISNHIEEMLTPEYSLGNPVYRFMVIVKHAANEVLKVDSKGNIISAKGK